MKKLTTKNAENTKKLTAREVMQELHGCVRVLQNSYREADGVVHEPGVLRTIAALEAAIQSVRMMGKLVDAVRSAPPLRSLRSLRLP